MCLSQFFPQPSLSPSLNLPLLSPPSLTGVPIPTFLAYPPTPLIASRRSIPAPPHLLPSRWWGLLPCQQSSLWPKMDRRFSYFSRERDGKGKERDRERERKREPGSICALRTPSVNQRWEQ
ncbi:hypothetical protein E2C01_051927 [Portunus trituberculatus]|uniref:Uncharacterized protein n=1 Tax=Portunus trituberculatus TaxID=210409 RepID=A0A5B7GKM2_PORTR|nr:hypothetical protein [Portunus trituberculatus]